MAGYLDKEKGSFVDQPVPMHGAAKHTDVARELFIPALEGYSPGGTRTYLGLFGILRCADAATTEILATIKVPDDFVSFSSVKLAWSSPAAAGDMYWQMSANYAANGEVWNTHSDTPGYGVTTMTLTSAIQVEEPALPLTLASLAIGDYVGLYFARAGGDALDTLTNVVNVFGFLFTYVANQ